MSPTGCISRCSAPRLFAICPMAVQDQATGARPWQARRHPRCHLLPLGSLGGNRHPTGLMPPPRAAAAATGPRCHRLPWIPTTTTTSIGSPARKSRNAVSATRDGGGLSGSDGGEAASVGSGGGGVGDAYGEYGYDYDLDSQPPGPGGRGASLAALAANLSSFDDTNALQTALAAAIALEDFELAAAVRDRLRQVAGGGQAGSRIDWGSTGMSNWLADRGQRLGYKFPTEIQRRSAPVLLSGSDAVVASETGSGKTLSFLMPLLARLTYPPDVFLDQMKGPQALVVVPTLELGVQVALLAFRLLGGNVSSGTPGDEANMFTYFGPKGIKVRGVLNKEEVVMSKASLTYLTGVHLLVATPGAIMEAVREPQPAGQLLKHIKVLAVDEVDECFAAFPTDMAQLMAQAADGTGKGNSFGTKPQVIFVGATQRADVLQAAVAEGWLREPVSIQVGREGTVPPALSHRYICVPSSRRLTALARSLRADLAAADQDGAPPARVMLFVNTPAEAAAVAEPLRSSLWSDHRMAVLVPPGTILGRDVASDQPPGARPPAASPTSAPNRSSAPARPLTASSPPTSTSAGSGSGYGSASWAGDMAGTVDDLLDDMFAYNPIRALHSFRDNKSSLLLATGGAARGLDLPGVTHVYSLGPPPDATQYLHRAGRAGRIGSTSGGIVTTLVTPEELPSLLEMGRQLGLTMVREEEATGELCGTLPRLQAPPDDQDDGDGQEGVGDDGAAAEGPGAPGGAKLGDVDKLRKGLEDLFNLM